MNIFDLQATISLNANSLMSGLEDAQKSFNEMNDTVADGSAEIGDGIENISDSIQDLISWMDEMNKPLSGFDGLSSDVSELSDEFADMSDSASDASDGVGDLADSASDVSSEVSSLSASSADAAGSLQEVGSAAADAGRESENSVSKWDLLKSKFREIVSSAGDAAKILTGSLAVAAAGAVTGIVSVAKEAAYAADDLNTLSKQTGISTDTLQKFQYASDLIDVSTDTLTGSLTKLTRNMYNAREGSGDAADAFEALGIAFADSEGNLRDRKEVFYEVIAALGEIENVTERDATAMQIFGRSAQDLNPLIMGGVDAFKELSQQAEDAGLILSQDALNGLNELSDALDTAKATAAGFKNVFGTAFAGTLASALTTVTGFAQEVTGAFQEGFSTDGISGALSAVGELISSKFSGIASDISSKIPELTGPISEFGAAFESVAGGAISSLAGEVAKFASTVASVSADTVEAIATGVKNFIGAFDSSEVAGIIGTIAGAAADLFGTLMSIQSSIVEDLGNAIKTFLDAFDYEGAASAISSIASKAAELFSAFSSAVAERIKSISERFSGFATKIAELATKFPVDFGKIGSAVSGMIGTLVDLAKKFEEFTKPIRDFFGTVLSTLIQGAVGIVVGAAGGIINAFADIVDFINNSLGAAIALLSGDFEGAAEKVKAAWGNIVEFFKDIWQGIKGAFAGAKAAFGDIGRDLVEGLKNGVLGAWDSFISTIKEKCSGLISKVMGWFGEHSPSKVFSGIGFNLVAGMEKGWSSEFGDLERMVGNDVSSLTGTARVGFEDSAIGRSSAAGITSMLTAGAGASSQPVEVNLVLDGEVAAKVLYDPLRNVAWQKGKAEAVYA